MVKWSRIFFLFWNSTSPLRTAAAQCKNGFDIYLVNVKTMRMIAQIFVAFSEKQNFKFCVIIGLYILPLIKKGKVRSLTGLVKLVWVIASVHLSQAYLDILHVFFLFIMLGIGYLCWLYICYYFINVLCNFWSVC